MTLTGLMRFLLMGLLAGLTPSALTAWAQVDSGVEPPPAEVELQLPKDAPVLALWRTAKATTVSLPIGETDSTLRLHPGAGCLILVREGYSPLSFVLTLKPDARESLTPSDWEEGVYLAGTIRTETGTPLHANATVQPVVPVKKQNPAVDYCLEALREGGAWATQTDDEGAYRLGPLAAGTFKVAVSAEDYATAEAKVVLSPAPKQREPLNFTLHAVARLELGLDLSRVAEDYPFEVAVERANLEPHPYQRDDWIPVGNATVAEDTDLRFELAPGLHRVAFSKEGTDILHFSNLMLAPGTNFFVLRPWPITVYGKVTDADGPIEDARVGIMCAGHQTTARTSEDGEYEADLWTATACAIFVKTADKRVHMTSVDVTDADFGDRIEKNLSVTKNTVEGIVVDKETGDPVAGASVSLKQVVPSEEGEGRRPTKTNEDGRFDFRGVRGNDSDRTVVEARADGYLPESQEIVVEDDVPTPDVRFELERSDRITGRVVGPGGEPVAGAIVGCCAATPSGMLEVYADTNPLGEFTLDGYQGAVVFAAAPGYTIGWAPASTEDVVVPLAPRATPVRIQLVDKDREPVPGVYVLFSSPGSGIIPLGAFSNDFATNRQTSRTDQDGVLVTTALPSGVYRAWMLGRGGLPTEVGVVLVPSSGDVTLHTP